MMNTARELNAKIADMVTRDALELRLAQERLESNRAYVTQDYCEKAHVKVNGKLDHLMNGQYRDREED